ncbi:MAG: rhodanese-like domain-containing protein, partial [Methanothrix sp.]|nr:rhodanese-like domain-containing protein [Methanothrix sp.]
SRSVGLRKGLRKAGAVALAFSLLAVVFLNFLISSALAGTETGEFCPTCPDWTDLDGWLAKKDAYERAQMNAMQGSQSNVQVNGQTVSVPSTAKPSPPEKGYMEPNLITSPSSLKSDEAAGSQIISPVILDVRAEPDYSSGHIPGARILYWKSMQKNGLLDQSSAREALERAGVRPGDRLLIYGDSGEGAYFVFWALCYLGQNNVSLLDGGADAAQAEGVAFTMNAPAPEPSNYTASIVPWLQVTAESLEGMLEQTDTRILDARDFSLYGQSRLGNESICLSLDKLFDNSRIKDAATLGDLFDRRLENTGTVIVYGTPQAYSLFYSLRLMGYNATLLEGDWWKETKWAVSNIK